MTISDIARTLGRKGGQARARRLSAADRTRIASLGGQARTRSLRAARRIADNFRYVSVLEALRPRPGTVRRVSAFAGPLPGIYRADS